MIYLLKNTIQWLKNHLGLFKAIFLISVIVIIVGELMSIGKTLSIQQLGETFATIPVWKSGLMLLIGLISVLPMVGYDIILNRMLEQKQNPRYLFETIRSTILPVSAGLLVWGFALNYMDKRKRAET